MTPFMGELIGTSMLMLLGNGVNANVVLSQTKGHDSGWLVIAIGWGLAVFTSVFMVASISGAHLNPAVTVGLALAGNFSWASVPSYLLAQFLGAGIGAFLCWAVYKPHFDATEDPAAILGTFSTGPAIKHTPSNLLSEIAGTFALVIAVLFISGATVGDQTASLGSLDALPVGLVVIAIGLCLGGPTGYAINPARDLSPRIMHAILPIKSKQSSDWAYSWIPVVGPFIGGLLAGALFLAL
ncbi:MAG: MIP/aquaporin family protein [Bacteroidota bacterium]